MSRVHYHYLEEKEAELIANDPIETLISYFNLSVEPEIGNDDFVYQEYIEFPTFDHYDFDDINKVIDIFDIDLDIDLDKFPFEEEIQDSLEIQKLLSFLPERIANLCKYDEDEIILTFPNEDQVRDEI